MRGPGGLRFEQVVSFERLRELRAPWRALWERAPAATPFSAPEWLLPWCRHLAEHAPWSVAAWRGDDLVGLAPTFVYRAGGERVLGLLGGGVSDYQDVLAEDVAAASAILEFLRAAAPAFDRCELRSLPSGSMLLACVAPDDGAALSRDDVCPVLTLPRRFDDLRAVASGGLLADVRRQRRVLGRTGGLEVVRAPPDDPGELVEALFRLHEARWRSRGGEGVLAGAALARFHADAVRELAAAGMLRLVAVRWGRRIIAVLYAHFARGRLYTYLQGIEPTATRMSPGSVVLAAAIEDAIAEGASEVDMLRGGEAYKYRWGAVDRSTFRLGLRPHAVNRPALQDAAPGP